MKTKSKSAKFSPLMFMPQKRGPGSPSLRRAATGTCQPAAGATPALPPKRAAFSNGISTTAIQRGEYWTLNRVGGISLAQAQRYGVTAQPHVIPHSGMTDSALISPSALMKHLKELGWENPKAKVLNSVEKIARVQVTANGFNVTTFDSYEAARNAWKKTRR